MLEAGNFCAQLLRICRSAQCYSTVFENSAILHRMLKLDAIDRRILSVLQEDGKISNLELSERVHLSPSACLRRVKALEESGVIDRYVMLLDPGKIGRATNVFVEVRLSSQSEESLSAFEAAVARMPTVMECYTTTGQSDYLMRVATGGAEDYERIHRQLARLPGVAGIHSNFALRTVLKRTAFPL